MRLREPVAIDLPFRIGADGGIATTRDVGKQIRQRIVSIVGTEPGERVMLSVFGVPVLHYVFEPSADIVSNELTEITRKQMNMWERGVIVNEVVPIPKRDESAIATIDIKYTRTDAPESPIDLARSVHSASIDARGRLKEVIRG
jgi:Phage baseplate assembly protein W